MTDRLEELRAQVAQEQAQAWEAEAKRRLAGEQITEQQAQVARWGALEQAARDYAPLLERCREALAAMLVVFNQPSVDIATLKAAHDSAVVAYEEAFSFANRAVGLYIYGRAVWTQTYANTEFIQAFAKFAPSILPAYALMRWIADAPDAGVKNWRIGLFVMFYGASYFQLNMSGWPHPTFDPLAATKNDLETRRFYKGQ